MCTCSVHVYILLHNIKKIILEMPNFNPFTTDASPACLLCLIANGRHKGLSTLLFGTLIYNNMTFTE